MSRPPLIVPQHGMSMIVADTTYHSVRRARPVAEVPVLISKAIHSTVGRVETWYVTCFELSRYVADTGLYSAQRVRPVVMEFAPSSRAVLATVAVVESLCVIHFLLAGHVADN